MMMIDDDDDDVDDDDNYDDKPSPDNQHQAKASRSCPAEPPQAGTRCAPHVEPVDYHDDDSPPQG